jgi:hypothetical protein
MGYVWLMIECLHPRTFKCRNGKFSNTLQTLIFWFDSISTLMKNKLKKKVQTYQIIQYSWSIEVMSLFLPNCISESFLAFNFWIIHYSLIIICSCLSSCGPTFNSMLWSNWTMLDRSSNVKGLWSQKQAW